MHITMARGDVFSFSFGLYIDGVLSTEEMDNVYFTVKSSHYMHNPLFQKKCSDGSIASDTHGSYTVIINPEDTDGLDFGDYVFDIEVVKLPGIKRTFTGTLSLTEEVTHRSNEEE